MGTTVRSKLEQVLGGAMPAGHLGALMLFLGALCDREVGTLGEADLDECHRWVAQVLRSCSGGRPVDSLIQQAVSSLAPKSVSLWPPSDGAAGPVSSTPAPPDAVARWSDPASSPSSRFLATRAVRRQATAAGGPGQTAPPPDAREITVAIDDVDDVVQGRMQAKHLALQLGFTEPSAIRIATAVSELARNIIFYAKQGKLKMEPLLAPFSPRVGLRISATDHGPGIENLELVMSGKYKSTRGLGLGLRGVRQLMDDMDIDTVVGRGTTITATKWLS